MSPATQPNRLIHETSPYLKQHAHNPVDWHPWGPEALALARKLDRPIFLSVGYSACHWCHVMEHESFEDAGIAAILNEHFVCIKVDREERPDVDQIYMTAVQVLTQMITGHAKGVWPMSVFLTPDLKPFYGGTYYPPDDRYGRPGFKRLLLALAEMWRTRRDELLGQGEQVSQFVREASAGVAGDGDPAPAMLQAAVRQLARGFDRIHGGFGMAPKFPLAVELRVLLRVWKRFQDDDAHVMARLTLDKMAQGGIYDHLGGGFHRYSTDERWLAPHFEKMLYDNALLSEAYLEAHQATGEPFYLRVVEETLDYVLREMTGPDGAFYSTQDADSEGEEGKFYVWSAGEIEQVLGKELADLFGYVYDVSPQGNWEGHTILHRTRSEEQDAKMRRIDVTELRTKLAEARAKLLEVRSRRVWPGRDEKILTAWNGLMIASFAEAGAALGESRYTDAAARAADFILTRMRAPDGKLFRTTFAGASPKLNAYLEDYAYFVNALVSVYEATFAPRWLEAAVQLSDIMIDQFWDTTQAGFFFTGKDHEELIARVKDAHDSSTPSGNAMAVTALLRLAELTGRGDFREKAEKTLRASRPLLEKSPLAAGQMLLALDYYLGPVQEFAVVGDPAQDETRRVLRAIFAGFRPNKAVALKTPTGTEDAVVALLKDRPAKGTVTTYVCENFTCREPLVGAEAVEKALS
ncbi:thioredoxin [Planctomycetaceae bacterium SCGC AG-212-F19]|nr:thioredoxin [Planctomycetaceae bacterium SCGC AG-212-F19]